MVSQYFSVAEPDAGRVTLPGVEVEYSATADA